MDRDSPGHSFTDDDIEMIDRCDAREALEGNQNGSAVASNDSYDEDDAVDDTNNDRDLLLGGHGSTHEQELPEGSSPRVWIQVKSIVVESAPTLLLTTISLLFTGKLLDEVSRWRAMEEVDQLIMIIPAVLNLGGNLEMNLSARLGTAAHVGELDDPVARWSIIIGSLSLLQVQAISVSFFASCVALIFGRFLPRTTHIDLPSTNNSTTTTTRSLVTSLHARQVLDVGRKSGFPTLIMVASTAMTAAALSGLILGTLICSLVLLCQKFGLDPDNIVPAVASCAGDLFTLVLIGVVSTLLIPFIRTAIPLVVGLLVVFFAISCLIYTWKNKHIRPLIGKAWSPLFVAVGISSVTGIVLDMFVSKYEGFAILAVVISGLPGAVGSILVSRLSTSLHAAALTLNHSLPSYSTPSKKADPSPRLAMITLLLITLPVEAIFLSVLKALEWLNPPLLFATFSIFFFCCTVLISLFIARFLTDFLWSRNRDPDMYALPIHSALMDLVGQLLLVLCFEIVSGLGGHVRMKG